MSQRLHFCSLETKLSANDAGIDINPLATFAEDEKKPSGSASSVTTNESLFDPKDPVFEECIEIFFC